MGKNLLSKSEGVQAKRFKEGKEFEKEEKYDKEEERVKKKINNIVYIIMNTYAEYPINNANAFFNKDYQVKTSKEKNCFQTQEYKEECTPDAMYGYQKPLKEQCATITGGKVPPEEQCNSLWNNMTRRKTLIKDY